MGLTAMACAALVAGGVPVTAANAAVTGVVPNVLWWNVNNAIPAIEAAGFVASASAGPIDCGPPFVRSQSPAGGTSAPAGTTVLLTYSRNPPPGTHCP